MFNISVFVLDSHSYSHLQSNICTSHNWRKSMLTRFITSKGSIFYKHLIVVFLCAYKVRILKKKLVNRKTKSNKMWFKISTWQNQIKVVLGIRTEKKQKLWQLDSYLFIFQQILYLQNVHYRHTLLLHSRWPYACVVFLVNSTSSCYLLHYYLLINWF